jgi:hypothetical protein
MGHAMKSKSWMMLRIVATLFIGAPSAILTASELVPGRSNDKGVDSGVGVEKRLPDDARRDRFSARVLEVKEDHLRVSLPELKEERVLHLEPALLRILGKIPDRVYTMGTNERRLPSGLTGALTLQDQRGLYAVLESIRDRPLLTPEERAGMQVAPQPSGDRILVYESECAIVYNVPTVFILGHQRFVLQAFENKQVTIGDDTYTLSLQTSRWTVEKSCSSVFEGAQTQVDYALVREQAVERRPE